MNFTIPKIIDSIAGQLASLYPNVPVYDSPSYNTSYPCFYVFVECILRSTSTATRYETGQRDEL